MTDNYTNKAALTRFLSNLKAWATGLFATKDVATSESDGLMSSEDKNSLDNLNEKLPSEFTDQKFFYRNSPVEYDGTGTIKKIKGSTVKFNQLIQNGNFADTSAWDFPSTSQSTTSISNNELSATYVASYPSVFQQVTIKKGHKFYLSFEFKASVNKNTPNGFFFRNSNNQSVLVTQLNYTTSYQKYEGILSYSDADLVSIGIVYFEPSRWTAGDVINIKNVVLSDLTAIFGSGNEPTTVEEFETWLSNNIGSQDYYSYTPGRLISFGDYGKVNFNQHITNYPTTTQNGITVTNNGDGSYTINGTSTSYAIFRISDKMSLISSHKYYVKGGWTPSTNIVQGFVWDGTTDNIYIGTESKIITSFSDDNRWFAFRITNAQTVNNVKVIPQVIDLTQMFGAGNEPTIEEFEQLYPNAYYGFTTGREEVIDRLAIKTVGFNQWDEEWRSCDINAETGEIISGDYVVAKNFISVLPNTDYYICVKSYAGTGNVYLYQYSADLTYLGISGYKKIPGNTVFKTDNKASYILFLLGSFYGTTYKNDVCLNISNTSKNGTYEPYTTSTLSLPISTLFPTGIKEAGSLYDEASETEASTRVETVDLGTLNWLKATNQTGNITEVYTDEIASLVKHYSNDITASTYLISSKYSNEYTAITSYRQDIDNCIVINNSGRLIINDNSFADKTVQEIKSLLSGVYLNYQLATPISQDIDLDLFFKAYEGGTEQLLPVNGATPVTAPIIVDIQYNGGFVSNLAKVAYSGSFNDLSNKPGNASTSAAGFMSSDDKTKLNGIAAGAEVNQNAFSNVVVGSTTISADGKTDSLTLVAGSNVTLTGDATNDKVTIAATNTWRGIQNNLTSDSTSDSLAAAQGKYLKNNKAEYRSIGGCNDYQRVVIALCELSLGARSGSSSHTSGSIVSIRTNGFVPEYVSQFVFQDNYVTAKSCNYSFIGNFENTSATLRAGEGFRACTFTYNSKYYGGLEFYQTQARNFYWYGEGNFEPFLVPYYNYNTSAVLNAEINNSISHSTSLCIRKEILADKAKNVTGTVAVANGGTGATTASGALTNLGLESKAAASGGTDVSLVTTGEKYSWNNKQNALVSGTNIKSVNGNSLLGSGNITISGGASITDIYPVGSIYMSVNNTDPGTLFAGTTWERIKDTFLLSAGDTYTAGDTGGSATHSHTFTGSAVTSGDSSAANTGGTTLTTNQIPSHHHSITNYSHQYTPGGDFAAVYANGGTNTGNTGGGQSHSHTMAHTHSVTAGGSVGDGNNMPPYLVVYVWKRVS